MLIYEYYCEMCDDTFDRFSRVADRDQQICHTCSTPAKRRLSAFRGLTWAPTAGGMR